MDSTQIPPKADTGITLILAIAVAALFFLVGMIEGMHKFEDELYKSCRDTRTYRTDYYVVKCAVAVQKGED